MLSEKIKIEKNSVQETLLVPLYGRKMCAEKFPELYSDTSAKELCERLDYDFSQQEARKDSFLYSFGALEAAMRQLDIMQEIKDYLKEYPEAVLVNLGCGLDQTGRVCDNGTCSIINVDFPNTIAARAQLIPLGEREENVACDLNDYAWMDMIDGKKGVLFFAAGVFHYFKTEQVKKIVFEIAKRFPGGRLVFDTVGKFGLKLMLKKTLKNMGMSDVGGFFSVDDLNVLDWSCDIRLSRKAYMLGYHDMKAPGIGPMHRFLAKIADRMMKMSIICMDFKKE